MKFQAGFSPRREEIHGEGPRSKGGIAERPVNYGPQFGSNLANYGGECPQGQRIQFNQGDLMGELAKHTISGTVRTKDVGEAVQELMSTMNQVAV
ncbi:MAG: hypothetical protein CBC46_06875 [Verrucomicrobiaceae bacterium TMED86]|nr:MAG: hypothetical protein CBC46_06875 [Verrucomicrobiaceae bacterium TMED86]